MLKAIKLAVKNGYKESKYGWNLEYIIDKKNRLPDTNVQNDVLLDKNFWVALFDGYPELEVIDGTKEGGTTWRYYWHKFIDWIAEDKDPEDFFKKLWEV